MYYRLSKIFSVCWNSRSINQIYTQSTFFYLICGSMLICITVLLYWLKSPALRHFQHSFLFYDRHFFYFLFWDKLLLFIFLALFFWNTGVRSFGPLHSFYDHLFTRLFYAKHKQQTTSFIVSPSKKYYQTYFFFLPVLFKYISITYMKV